MSVVVLDAQAMKRTLGRLAHEILEANGGGQNLVVLGILKKGWPVAKRLAFVMAQIEDSPISHGKLDISGARDDRESSDQNQSEVPFSITGKNVVLVDEVIYTGRTIRAALNEMLKYGRPASVKLAVLIDRGHRELPIQPDYCGKSIVTAPNDFIEMKLAEFDGEDAVIHYSEGERA